VADGVAGEKAWTELFALHSDLLTRMSAQLLSQQDIESFACASMLDVPVVRALLVEPSMVLAM
jgi:hypothetical protein